MGALTKIWNVIDENVTTVICLVAMAVIFCLTMWGMTHVR